MSELSSDVLKFLWLKDTSEIWTRLFDHKVFLCGEILFTLREFEEKRNDVEVEHLFKVLEQITDISGVQCKRLQESTDLALSNCEPNLKEALNVCDSIYNLEETCRQDRAINLQQNKRKLEWEEFVDNLSDSCTQIDNLYEQKEEEFKRLYSNLQTKIN